VGASIGHHGLLLRAPATGTGLLTGLVSWWDFEESSGNRADAQGSNTLTPSIAMSSAAGKVGNCATPATGNLLTKASPSGVDFTSGDFTIAGWINTSASNCGLISRWATGSNARIWTTLLEAGVAKFAVSTDGATVSAIVTVGSGLNNSAWHLVLGWRDATGGNIYVQVDNGTPAAVAFSGASTLYSAAVTMAAMALDGAGVYSGGGSVDSSGCWSRMLTSTERGLLWNSGAGLNYAAL
jgi:hypothetical protein